MKARGRIGLLLATAVIAISLFSINDLPAAAAAGASNYGLHVEDDGTITVGGKPYYGVGVNFYDGFNRYAAARPTVSSEITIKNIAKAEIPFIRVSFSSYRTNGVSAYIEKPTTYFKYMDQFVQWANENRVGIIATLFWNIPAWTGCVEGAADKDIGNPNSKLMKLMLKYTDDVISRYKDNPAIWGWEIANEVNLATDIGSSSNLELKDVQAFYTAVSAEIRKYDTYRLISNGDATYRKEQYNLSNGKGWAQDTEAEFRQIVAQFAPGRVDTISFHPYAADFDRFNRPVTIEEEMKLMASIAKSNKKALFVGEFGVGDASTCASPEAPAYTQRMMNAIRDNGVQLAAIWNMDMLDMDIEKGYYPEQSFAVTGPTAYKYLQTKEINAYYRGKSMQDNAAGWVSYVPGSAATTTRPPSTAPQKTTTRRPTKAVTTKSGQTTTSTASGGADTSVTVDMGPTTDTAGDSTASTADVATSVRQSDTPHTESSSRTWLVVLIVIAGVLVLGGGAAVWYFLRKKRA